MKLLSPSFARAASVLLLTLATSAAQAHTGHGTAGVADGLAHPFGMDHLLTTAALHFGGVMTGLSLRRYWADKANWAVSGLGVAFGGAGLYLFGQI
ncbi:MAG: urease accessory protein [Comamonadaceae bacterium]|nr:MAG: urease accessory protein [Comamonadaceae bacterium]